MIDILDSFKSRTGRLLLKKRYGQHFISDRNLLRRIVQFAQINPSGTVLEIGPGGGSLTRELAVVCQKVIAIEIDRDLIETLKASLPVKAEVVEGDALQIPFEALTDESFHVVGNLPYNVATALLKKFIENRERIVNITIMLQKEVAERVCAEPGTREYGPLSILVQYYAKTTWGFEVPPGSFSPKPKVDSAVIRIDWKPGVPYHPLFTDFVHRAFSSRRKKLMNNLLVMLPSRSRGEIAGILRAAGLSPDVRAESLSVDQFLHVYNQSL